LLEDLTERVETLENIVYQLQKNIIKMPFGEFVKYDLSQTFTISGAGSFEIGAISGSFASEMFILCKINCVADIEVTLKVSNAVVCSKKITANSDNSLQIFAVKANSAGSVAMEVGETTSAGSISDISVFIGKNATFCEVSA